jgi:exopolysaccharide production protein ExoQ
MPPRYQPAAGRAAAAAVRPRPDNKFQSALVTGIFWLLILRIIIPGFFDYGNNVNILQVAQRDAVINVVTWLSFLFIPILLLAGRLQLTLRVLRATNPALLVLLGYTIISLAWSIDPSASFSRLTHALTLVLDCLAVVMIGWTPTRVQDVARPILTVVLLGSVIFCLGWPDLAITPPVPPDTKYYWHGLAQQKNGLGSLATLAAVFWFHAWISKEKNLLTAMVGIFISVACMVLSRSSTAIMATAFAWGLMFMMLRTAPSMRRYMPYIIGAFVVMTLAYSMAVLKVVPGLDILLKPITALSGKDTTFTARTQIWDIIRAHIQLSPWIGSGYGGYWVGQIPTSPSYVFLKLMYFYPSEAHNGYLDIINDLGYVGLLILLWYLVTYIRHAVRLLRYNYTQTTLYLALIFQQMLTNLSETHWLFVGHDFAVLTLATFGMARTLLDGAAKRRAAMAAAPVAPVMAVAVRRV